MAHFAECLQIGDKKIVQRVIVVSNRDCLGPEGESEEVGSLFCQALTGGGNWVQTSYNASIRYNFAGIGYDWLPDFGAQGAFVEPQPYSSWSLDAGAKWQAPIPIPEEGGPYQWDEANLQWRIVA